VTLSIGVAGGLDETGVADGLDDKLGDGLVVAGLEFELGEGLDGRLDAVADVTVGELKLLTVV
jgi:hypothetical protein